VESEEPATDIISAAKRHLMFCAGDRALAAVSGGPDSVAMLHALHASSSELEITLHVAHLNHGIRGEQSNLDEEFVRNLAHEFGLPVTTRRADVPALAAEMHIGIEEAARVARHRFLRETAASVAASKIAIAHTADDRAETIVLNIIRGCGVDGLAAMRAVDGMIVRPLIETTRAEVEQYIADNSLPFRIDETNADTTYARNRVRHELIPLIEHEFNAQVKPALIRLGEIAASQSELIQTLTPPALGALTYRDGLDAQLFASLPEALQFQVVRAEIRRLKGDLADVTFEQVERIVCGVRCGEGFTITLPSGRIYASLKHGVLRFHRADQIAVVPAFEHQVSVPGETMAPEIGLRLQTAVTDEFSVAGLTSYEALIDVRAVVGALRVRNVKPGDCIVPLGMSGHKKLQDVFVDKKIPKRQRARAAVVCDDEKILWVVGVVTSELSKVTPATREAIHLTAMCSASSWI